MAEQLAPAPVPLASLTNCAAMRGLSTYKPKRTQEDEEQERTINARLGTFSAHSTILSFIEFLEGINRHLARVDGDSAKQRRLLRVIAKVKMGAAAVTARKVALPSITIAEYIHMPSPVRGNAVTGRLYSIARAQYLGSRNYVFKHGAFNRAIVDVVALQLAVEDSSGGGASCAMHDSVFEITLEANSRLAWPQQEYLES